MKAKDILERQNDGTNFDAIVFNVAVSFTRISTGMLYGIFGPTLLYLAGNVGTGVHEVSFLLTGLNLGFLLGGLFAGNIRSKVNNVQSFALAQILMAICMAVIPVINSLWLLILAGFISGFMFGYLDAGVQAIILQIWGEQESRSTIALYHFVLAVGALLAPVIVRPFLDSDSDSEEDVCPIENPSQASLENSTKLYDLGTTKAETSDDIKYAYFICAGYTFLCGIIFIVLDISKTVEKLRVHLSLKSEERKKEPLRDVYVLLILIVFFYFLHTGVENIVVNYIYSVTVCSNLHFEPEDAALLNTVFWIGYTISRFLLIILFNFMNPRNVMTITLFGGTFSLGIEALWGEKVIWVAWTVAFFGGFFIAAMYPIGVSWSSQHTNMSERYIGMFSVGAALGPMIFLPISGLLFEDDPFYTMYLAFIVILAVDITFVGVNFYLKFRNTTTAGKVEINIKHEFFNVGFVSNEKVISNSSSTKL